MISNKDGFEVIITGEETALKMVKDYKVEAAYIIKEGFKENFLREILTELLSKFLRHPQ